MRFVSRTCRLGVFAVLLFGCGEPDVAVGPSGGDVQTARFVREIRWTGRGVWLKTDTHLHTKFSDGAHTVEKVAEMAARYGCDVIAITDHADRDLDAATPEYAAAIEAARLQHQTMIILSGVEWNLPPWGGDEHATVLVPPGKSEWRTLALFKGRFDDLKRPTHEAALADEALRWLGQQSDGGSRPLVIVNHPSRKRTDALSLEDDFVRWRGVNDVVIGFSGAAGHQRADPLGAYQRELKLIDRWDPAAAIVGGAWDRMLGRGLDVWAARAASDLHRGEYSSGNAKRRSKPLSDYWPGEFSETWLYAPDASPAGVFKAFRSGSFFAAHGQIVRKVELTVAAEGLPRPAVCGEVIEVPRGSSITIRLRFEIPEVDWQGQPNRIDEVELIAIFGNGAEASAKVLAKKKPAASGVAIREAVAVPEGGMVIRARGRRVVDGEPDLMFYTNPIRVMCVE